MGEGTNRWQMSTHGITNVQTVRHHYRLTTISNIQLVTHMLGGQRATGTLTLVEENPKWCSQFRKQLGSFL